MPDQLKELQTAPDDRNITLKTKPLATMSGATSVDRLARLYDIVRSLNSIVQLDKLLYQIVASAAQMVEARGAFLMLIEPSGRTLKCEVTSGRASSSLKGVTLPLDERTVPGMVACRGEAYVSNDVSRSPFFASQKSGAGVYTIRKLVCVPLKMQDRTIGVVQVIDKVTGEHFNSDDLKLLEAMADTAAVAVENVRLYEAERRKSQLLIQAYEDLNRTYQATLLALTGLLDTRDTATRGHSSRVVAITIRLARVMGITDPRQLRNIEQGALLHDVGKIGVADAILRKPGPLDAEEWQEMRAHPELGYKMLKDITFLQEALPIVRYHHERYNGTGYPYGLEAEEIPLEARIFAVADAFDAITSERPYKKARTFEQAVATLLEDSGKYFDPQVVQAFLSVPKEEWEEILRQVAEAERVHDD